MSKVDDTQARSREPPPSLRRAMIVGTSWMVVMRWVIRGIGLISTIILARILQPEDFGLVAMASITIGLIETFLAFGVDMVLIQNSAATREDFDTAWTLRVIQGAVAALLVVVGSPLAVEYFGDPRLLPILWSLAAGLVIGSLANIGTVMFRKELQFDREFRFEVSKKIVAFAVTIAAAVMLRNYWALVIGIVTSAVSATVLSYLVHPYRPRVSLAAFSRIWSFSQWILVTNVGYYFETRSDELIVGGQLGARPMGLYSVGSEIAQLPTTEIAAPIARAIIPGFAQLQHEKERLRAAYANLFGAVLFIAVPSGLGLAVIAERVVPLALGEQWTDTVPLIKLLAVLGIIRITYGNAMNLMMAIGQVRAVALLTWGSVLAFFVSASLVVGSLGLIGVAAVKLVINAILLCFGLRVVIRQLELPRHELCAVAWRPLLAGCVMYGTLSAPFTRLPLADLWGLPIEIAAGAGIYATAILLLWRIAGKPAGIETLLMTFVDQKLAAHRDG